MFRQRQPEGKSYGPLNLSYQEAQFIHQFKGRRLEESKPRPAQGFWSSLFSEAVAPPKEQLVHHPSYYKIDTEGLAATFPALFTAYPQLSEAMRRNTLLTGKLMENQYGLSAAEPPGDF